MSTAKRKGQKKPKISIHKKPEDLTLDEWQAAIRQVTAETQSQEFTISYLAGEHPVYADFSVFSKQSGNTYKVALRSYEGGSFCSCLDFKTSGLGTCKHIEAVCLQLKNSSRLKKLTAQSYVPLYSSLYINYGPTRRICLRIGMVKSAAFQQLATSFFDSNLELLPEAITNIEDFLAKAHQLDADFRCYPDVMDYVIEQRALERRRHQVEQAADSLFKGLVRAELYPYQVEGVRFAYLAGRCLIADEMGLGKTVQALAATELFIRQSDVSSVVIVCPTSLKYQWKSEIEKFTDHQAVVVEGGYVKRRTMYRDTKSTYKIISYNVATSDVRELNQLGFDLVILDEAQRIKNWQTKTAQAIKKLESKYAIVLTGTPIENKLEELYSIVQFINPFKLGALYRFLDSHQIKDESGKVVGYGALGDVAKQLSDCVLRRTKKQVMQQLPGRVDKHVFVDMTPEQYDQHQGYADTVAQLVYKWRRLGFLDEKDRQRLLSSMNCMRMLADSTYILDQQTRFDTKIDELLSILDTCLAESGTKVVIFSQWERMTRLVRQELERLDIGYAYLHGGIPSEHRKGLLDEFRDDTNCRVFLSTDAGGVGLNLQSASAVINLDIPWNPAVLEQRIGRVYRHGQKRSVTAINLVSRQSIEERMLDVLVFKSSLFEGVLDGGSDEVFMGESKFKKLMNSVEEVIVKAPPTNSKPPIQDASEPPMPNAEQTTTANDLLTSAAQLFGNLAKTFSDEQAATKLVNNLVQTDDTTGKQYLKIPLDNQTVLTQALDVFNQFINATKRQ